MLELINPDKYTGCVGHPSEATGSKQVTSATITPCTYLDGWHDLRINFDDGTSHYGSSDSVRGCKQQFAFQCTAGSKWKEV